jgi:hypothetical protein
VRESIPPKVIQGNPMDPDPFEIVIRERQWPTFGDTYLTVVKTDEISRDHDEVRCLGRSGRIHHIGGDIDEFGDVAAAVSENSHGDRETKPQDVTKNPVERRPGATVFRRSSFFDLRSGTPEWFPGAFSLWDIRKTTERRRSGLILTMTSWQKGSHRNVGRPPRRRFGPSRHRSDSHV